MTDEYYSIEIASVYNKLLSPEETNKLLIEIVKEIRDDERAKIQRDVKRVTNIDAEMSPRYMPKRVEEEHRKNEIRVVDSNEREFTKPENIGEDY
jgi:hypothetical protein